MHKTYLFSVTCPECRKVHEKEIYPHEIALFSGQSLGYHFKCCGHEIGFSVRRVIGGAA